jgi:hypothetical protein
MARIRARLAELSEKLQSKKALLAKARRRYKAMRKRAFVAHNKQVKAQARADKLRAAGHEAQAEQADREALRFSHVAYKNHQRAQYWLGKVKTYVKHVHKLDLLADKAQEEQISWIHKHDPKIEGNRVVGGTTKQRWITACTTSVENCSGGKRRNFYSQTGSWDVKHEIASGPEYGERSDCSQYVTGMAWSAGLPDPNGANWTGGYTGTLIGEHNGWKRVSETSMKAHGWGYVVYGGGTGHHVEAFIGPGERTAGHGSAPVDYGVINLFGDSDFRCYILDA